MSDQESTDTYMAGVRASGSGRPALNGPPSVATRRGAASTARRTRRDLPVGSPREHDATTNRSRPGKVTNLAKENFSLNDWNIELHDDKGITYNLAWLESSSCSRGNGQARLGDQMPPGVAVRTTLLFDVAPGTSGKFLVLTQGDGRIVLE